MMTSPTLSLVQPPPAGALDIPAFLESLKEPVKTAFGGRSFTVFGEVEKATPWQNHFYVTLVEKSGKYSYSLSVFIRGPVLASCGIQVAPKMRLLVTGTVGLSRSEIQLTATAIEDIGVGRLQKQIEEWKKQYRPLFSREKKPMPLLCRRIALVSKPGIQGYGDFMKHLRYGHVDVIETKMQGEAVPREVAAAIAEANLRGGYDLICVVRGGGSGQDLFEYNAPAIMEAIAASAIPVATAVGHEDDFPLCDLAADIRFSTPTDAAKVLSERTETLRHNVVTYRSNVAGAFRYRADQALKSIGTIKEQVATAEKAARKAAGDRKRHRDRMMIAGAVIVALLWTLFLVWTR